jgi:hypothetical protein
VNGDAKNERIACMGDLSRRCLRCVRGGEGGEGLNLARLCSIGPEAEQETYDYPGMTLLPHVEAPLEQPRVTELVR